MRRIEDALTCIDQAEVFLLQHRKNGWWLHLSFVLRVLACECFCVLHWWRTRAGGAPWPAITPARVTAFLGGRLDALPSFYAGQDMFFLARVVEALLNLTCLVKAGGETRFEPTKWPFTTWLRLYKLRLRVDLLLPRPDRSGFTV